MVADRPPRVRVAARAFRRSRGLHPWVFRDDVVDDGGAGHGDLVEVVTTAGATAGHAFHSSRSKIRLRMINRDERCPDASFWAEVVRAAVEHRSRVVTGDTDACRLLFAESDGVPGLVVDRYGSHLVVQALTAGAESIVDIVLDALADAGVRFESVLARNDPAARALEGLAREVRQLRGSTPDRVVVREHGIRYAVDPWTGQKTGAFLDQRDNRRAAGALCRGRVLDAFSYHGSFALHAARNADEVIALDSSAEALARARENAELNGIGNLRCLEGNAFDVLRDLERDGQRFDTVLVDPPAFARSRKDVPAARRGYREINLRAMRLLRPDGILVTSSCSYNLGEPEFVAVAAEAAADAGRSFRVLERRTQAPDHPIRLGFPESHYLKCLVLRSQNL